jgi:hypothetical protein
MEDPLELIQNVCDSTIILEWARDMFAEGKLPIAVDQSIRRHFGFIGRHFGSEYRSLVPHNLANVAADSEQAKVSIAALTAATPLPKIPPLELRRIMPLNEAARLTGMSVDTLRWHHRDKIRRLSPRRLGMCVADALQIGGR